MSGAISGTFTSFHSRHSAFLPLISDLTPSCSNSHFHCAPDRDGSFKGIGICAKLCVMYGNRDIFRVPKMSFLYFRKVVSFLSRLRPPCKRPYFESTMSTRMIKIDHRPLQLSIGYHANMTGLVFKFLTTLIMGRYWVVLIVSTSIRYTPTRSLVLKFTYAYALFQCHSISNLVFDIEPVSSTFSPHPPLSAPAHFD